MVEKNGEESLSEPQSPPRSDKEQHDISLMAEAFAQALQSAAPALASAFVEKLAATGVTPQQPNASYEDQVPHQKIEEFEGVYPARRRHVIWFIEQAWRQSLTGLGFIVAIIAGAVLLAIFGGFGLKINLLIALGAFIGVILTILIVIITSLKPFMLWRRYKLEITHDMIRVGHPGIPWLTIDADDGTITRASVNTVKGKRRWFLFMFDAYDVTFDSASDLDEEFHDIKYVRGYKKTIEPLINGKVRK